MTRQPAVTNRPRSLQPRSRGWGDLFERFLDDFPTFFEPGEFPGQWVPNVDISESKSAITLEAEVPGMSPEDFTITVDGDLVRIRGEKKQEEKKEDKNYYRVERRYGSFERTLRLPAEVTDTKACATYKDGILKIALPKKKKAEQKAKQIEVKKG